MDKFVLNSIFPWLSEMDEVREIPIRVPFSLDKKKHGFLMVSRNQLDALYGEITGDRNIAYLLLCIQKHLYFKEGKIHLPYAVYTCNPGQWITSYSQLAEFTGFDRKYVKKLMDRMVVLGWLCVEKLGNYQCITYRGMGFAAPVKKETETEADTKDPLEG